MTVSPPHRVSTDTTPHIALFSLCLVFDRACALGRNDDDGDVYSGASFGAASLSIGNLRLNKAPLVIPLLLVLAPTQLFDWIGSNAALCLCASTSQRGLL